MALPELLTNCTAYVDGEDFLGRITKVKTPKFTLKMHEHQPGGWFLTTKQRQGMEVLEATITFSEISFSALSHFGIASGRVPLTVRGYAQNDQVEREHLIYMRGSCYDIEAGEFTPGDAGTSSELTVMFNLQFCAWYIDRVEAQYVDGPNLIHRAGGVDQLAEMRRILGRAA